MDPVSEPVIYVCAESLAKQDGPALHISAVVREMTKLGQPIILIQQGPFEIDGVEVIDVGETGGGIRAGARLRKRLGENVRRILDSRSVKAIYCRGSFPQVAQLANTYHVPLIVEYNGILKHEIEASGVDLLRRWSLLRRERMVSRHVATSVAVDITTRDGMVEQYPWFKERCVVIENGCDVDHFAPAVNSSERTEHRIAFAGGFNPWIRLDLLIRAMALLPDHITLEIAGDGPRREEFESLVNEHHLTQRVTFHGWMSHRDVPALYARCGIGFALYHDMPGGLPLKLCEYLAAGCAVVANRYKGFEFIDEKGFGRCLPAGPTEHDIAQAIEAILAASLVTPDKARERHNYAAQHYSWKLTAQKIIETIAQVTHAWQSPVAKPLGQHERS